MAKKADISIDQGADFYTSFIVADVDGVPINLSGYTGAAQIRKEYTSNTAVTMNVTVIEEDGRVEMTMNAATTAAMTPDKYVYDCELRSASNVVSRIIEGFAVVTPEVTR